MDSIVDILDIGLNSYFSSDFYDLSI